MNDGFVIQHHAMEFDQFDVTLKYTYLKVTEVLLDNDNVQVNNVSLQLSCVF